MVKWKPLVCQDWKLVLSLHSESFKTLRFFNHLWQRYNLHSAQWRRKCFVLAFRWIRSKRTAVFFYLESKDQLTSPIKNVVMNHERFFIFSACVRICTKKGTFKEYLFKYVMRPVWKRNDCWWCWEMSGFTKGESLGMK